MSKRQTGADAWWILSRRASRLGRDAQSVIALRLKRFSLHDRHGRAEARRMASEKVSALVEAQAAAIDAVLKGNEGHQVAAKVLKVYEQRVRANKRRLALNAYWASFAPVANAATKIYRRFFPTR